MKIVYFPILLFFSLSIHAQQLNCGVTSESLKKEMQQAANILPLNSNSRVSTTGVKYIPLTIHMVRHTNGTYGINSSADSLYHSLIMVNRILSDIGIQFYVNGNIVYIDNDAYLKTVRGGANNLALLNIRNPNTANVWIHDGWQNDLASGSAGPLSIELQNLSFSVVAHELGHFLTLAHTYDFVNGLEHVVRSGPNSNCSIAGDGICDTDADPFGLTVADGQVLGQNQTNASCGLTSQTKDLTGVLFNPPYNNIMSYYSGFCGMVFTPGQKTYMVNGYNQYHTAYTDMIGTGITTAPTNLTIINKNGYDILQWTNALNAVSTQIEVSSDNGTTWLVITGEDASKNSTIIHNVKTTNSYLLRARHLNSMSYSSSISYHPLLNLPLMPIYKQLPAQAIPTIGSVKLSNTTLNQISGANQNYSIYSPSSPIIVNRGGNYLLTISLNSSITANSMVGIWMDENKDGDFDDINELKQKYIIDDLSKTVSFTISEICDTGFVRLRVRSFYQTSGDPYSAFNNSEIEDYVLQVQNQEQPIQPFCIPVTTVSCGGSNYGIESFSIPSISFIKTSAACGITSNGYSDYTNQFVNLNAGQTYSFTETNGLNWNQSAKNLKIFIDFNHNSIFENNELVYSIAQSSITPDPLNGTFTLPANTLNGEARLRIRAYYNTISDACNNANYGETEDYTVVISGGKEEPVINMSITNITSNSLVLNWQKMPLANPTGYIIKISTDGQNYTTLATINSSTLSFTANALQSNTRYYFQVVAANSSNSDAKTIYGSTKAISTAIDISSF